MVMEIRPSCAGFAGDEAMPEAESLAGFAGCAAADLRESECAEGKLGETLPGGLALLGDATDAEDVSVGLASLGASF